ncbi:hypothetical protein AVEN_210638-1 [Araneus ventricosus]|uniref:Uncharacterized protein n=1 Tax=Araneus ventricosus TaxID=182803 RepID=A0A4Y2VTE5_ARAVE|nr:hypothetical protein AVEN_210638-1 [Araneus ventricosus]
MSPKPVAAQPDVFYRSEYEQPFKRDDTLSSRGMTGCRAPPGSGGRCGRMKRELSPLRSRWSASMSELRSAGASAGRGRSMGQVAPPRG